MKTFAIQLVLISAMILSSAAAGAVLARAF
jgi:hypothetical protein